MPSKRMAEMTKKGAIGICTAIIGKGVVAELATSPASDVFAIVNQTYALAAATDRDNVRAFLAASCATSTLSLS